MKILGLLIILNTLVLTGWWVSTDHPYKSWVVAICIIALFVGTFMILQDRAIEVSFKGVGTIKAAAQQAMTDATVIADIKNRVESQGATVDLVAKSAKEAKKLVGELEEKSESTDKNLSELNKTMTKASVALEKIEQITDIATTILAAQNENWEAFDQLAKWVEDKSFPLRDTAANAYLKVRLSYVERTTDPGYLKINWVEGVDPNSLPLSRLVQNYSKLNSVYHPHFVNVVWGRSDIPKKDRMAFLIQVLTDSNSICARHFAGKYFVAAAGDADLKWKPFEIEPLLNWWKAHNNKIE